MRRKYVKGIGKEVYTMLKNGRSVERIIYALLAKYVDAGRDLKTAKQQISVIICQQRKRLAASEYVVPLETLMDAEEPAYNPEADDNLPD